MLPTQQLLEKVSQEVRSIPNKRKESKRKVHYGCYLLCSQSGLRISEAVKFDLNTKTKKGLYRIEKPKGKSERLVYVSKKVIGELKANNWQPNQTNRWNFYHFLRKIKKELGIDGNIELSPHTLRRAFATYHAESGLPLPLLQKLLGHSSIRTTALYWQNIYGEDDPTDILTGKKWLESHKLSQRHNPSKNRKPPKPPTKTPIKVNLEKTSQLLGDNLPLFNPPPNYLSKINQLESQLSQIQSETKLLEAQNTRLNSENSTLRQEKSQLQQDLSATRQLINQLKQNLTNEQAKRINVENNLFTEKQNNHLLKETITNLTHKFHADEQNPTLI